MKDIGLKGLKSKYTGLKFKNQLMGKKAVEYIL
jgi:hypothetical protein